MKLLCIDTTKPEAVICLNNEGKASCIKIPDTKRHSEALLNEIENFLSCNENKTDFSDLQAKIIEEEGALQDSDKNKIWNFTLLDESTNKEYGNMIFPIKRAFVANKENGYKIKYEIKNGALEESSIHNEIAFVPPCTKNVFAKFYTTVPTTVVAWTKEDAKAYLADIKIKLDFYINRISGGKK